MKKTFTLALAVVFFQVSLGIGFADDVQYPTTEKEITSALSFKTVTVTKDGKTFESTKEGEVFVIVNGQRFRTKGLAGIKETKIVPKAAALINFDYNSALIKKDSYPLLDNYGKVLTSALADAKVLIEGHSDSIGPADYNLNLSEKRSKSVKKYLVEKYGINSNRLLSKGIGEEQPVASNDSEEGRAKNRRVQFVRFFN